MRQPFHIAASAALLVSTAESTILTWSSPQPTLAAMHAVFAPQQAPLPTPAPAPELLRKRQGNREQTCGFLNGALTDPIACPGGASCVVNTVSSLVGCCAGSGACQVAVTCVPHESSELGSAADQAQTLWCSDAAAPACATLLYLDPDHLGVSGYFCDSVETEYAVYYSAFAAGQTTAAPATTTRTKSDASQPASTSGSAANKSSGSSGPPIGAIVGGVVGGVALIALVAAALFLIARKNRRTPKYASVQQPPPHHDAQHHGAPGHHHATAYNPYGPGGGAAYGSPAMQQQMAVPMAYDDMAKRSSAAYSGSRSVTPVPVGSGAQHMPPPHSPPPGYQVGAPYDPDHVGMASHGYTDIAPGPAELSQEHARVVSELPVTRGHGEARELA